MEDPAATSEHATTGPHGRTTRMQLERLSAHARREWIAGNERLAHDGFVATGWHTPPPVAAMTSAEYHAAPCPKRSHRRARPLSTRHRPPTRSSTPAA